MWTRKSGFLFQDFLVVSYEWKILNLLFSKSFLLFEKFPVLKWYRLSIINSFFFCVLVSVHIDFSCIFFPGTGNYWNARGHLRNSVNRNIENNFAPPHLSISVQMQPSSMTMPDNNHTQSHLHQLAYVWIFIFWVFLLIVWSVCVFD